MKCGSGGPYDHDISVGGCGHHFCWACLEPFKGHTDFYNCDRKARQLSLDEINKRDKKQAGLTRYLECWRQVTASASPNVTLPGQVEEHKEDTKQLRAFEPILERKVRALRSSQTPNAYNIAESVMEAVEVLHRCRGLLSNLEIAAFYLEHGSVEQDVFRQYMVDMKQASARLIFRWLKWLQVVMRLSEMLQMDFKDITLAKVAS